MGHLASLFSPFWCLDAKGGEVALFRLLPGFAWVGHKHRFLICILLLVSTLSCLVYSSLNYVVENLFLYVCKTCGARFARKW